MQDVVQALVRARTLDREDVERLLDDADHFAIAQDVAADAAGVGLGHVLADVAEGDALLHLEDRFGKRLGLG